MTSSELVVRVLVVEVVLALLVLVAVFGRALWYRGAARRHAGDLARGRVALVAFLASPGDDAALAELETLRRAALSRLLVDLAPTLTGPHRQQLHVAARRLGLAGEAERLVRSPFWWRRLLGARLLTLVGGEDASLAALRSDRHPLVRAQFAESIGQSPSAGSTATLMSMLADPESVVARAAKESLIRMGTSAQPAIRDALRAPAADEHADILSLLDVAAVMPSSSMLDSAARLSASGTIGVRTRAVRLLRAIGGEAATSRLVELLVDSEPDVRAAAAAALGALAYWPASPAIARLLDDPEWDVRLSASSALQRLGAPGLLLLRRARDAGSGPGADVARQVLDIAERLGVVAAR